MSVRALHECGLAYGYALVVALVRRHGLSKFNPTTSHEGHAVVESDTAPRRWPQPPPRHDRPSGCARAPPQLAPPLHSPVHEPEIAQSPSQSWSHSPLQLPAQSPLPLPWQVPVQPSHEVTTVAVEIGATS